MILSALSQIKTMGKARRRYAFWLMYVIVKLLLQGNVHVLQISLLHLKMDVYYLLNNEFRQFGG